MRLSLHPSAHQQPFFCGNSGEGRNTGRWALSVRDAPLGTVSPPPVSAPSVVNVASLSSVSSLLSVQNPLKPCGGEGKFVSNMHLAGYFIALVWFFPSPPGNAPRAGCGACRTGRNRGCAARTAPEDQAGETAERGRFPESTQGDAEISAAALSLPLPEAHTAASGYIPRLCS